MKKISQASSLLKAFVGIGLLYILCFMVFTPRISFDDREMASIVSGVFMRQTPYEFMLFTHIWIGYLLKNLYLLYDGVAWYDLYLLLSLFSSQVIIYYVLLRSCKRFFWNDLVIFFFIGSLSLYALIRIHFTVVAGYVGFAGLLLFSLECYNSQKLQKVKLVVAIILMWWSSCIRFHAFLLAVIVFIPFIVYLTYNYWVFIRKNYSIKLFFLLLTIVLILGTRMSNTYIYSQHIAWEDHAKHIQYLVSIIDYDHFPTGPYQEYYQANHWSKNDSNMLLSWFFTDEHSFGLERLHNLLKDHNIYSLKFIRQRGAWFVLTKLKEALICKHAQIAYLACIFLLVGIKKRTEFIILFGCVTLQLLMILLYLGYFMKISNYHVTYLLFSLTILGLFYTFPLKYTLKNRFLSFLLLLPLVVVSIQTNSKWSNINQQKIYNIHQLIQMLRKDKLYVWWDIAPNYVATDFLENPQQTKGINLINLGHGAYKALIQETLAKYQMRNLHEGMINHKDVILVSQDYKNDFYQRYMKEHYSRNITFELLEEKHQFKFYKVLEKP